MEKSISSLISSYSCVDFVLHWNSTASLPCAVTWALILQIVDQQQFIQCWTILIYHVSIKRKKTYTFHNHALLAHFSSIVGFADDSTSWRMNENRPHHHALPQGSTHYSVGIQKSKKALTWMKDITSWFTVLSEEIWCFLCEDFRRDTKSRSWVVPFWKVRIMEKLLCSTYTRNKNVCLLVVRCLHWSSDCYVTSLAISIEPYISHDCL